MATVLALSANAAEKAGQKSSSAATAKATLKTEAQQVSYIIGTRIGASFKEGGFDVDLDSFLRGVKDALENRQLAFSDDEMRQILTEYDKRRTAEEARKNLAEGEAFLAENKKKPGVKVFEDGLQYKVLKEGSGRTPTKSDRVRVNYRGMFIDGREFDSSYRRQQPAEFAVTRVIPGWTEALLHMKEGAKWELYVPANLAYGERGWRGIPPNKILIFEIELLKVLPQAESSDITVQP